MLRVLLILVPLALAVYALVDCISTKDEEVKHLPKLVWILLIVLATVVGPLAWIFVGRERHRSGGGGGWGRGGAGRGGGWVAPDDNPEFLKSLGEARPPRRDPGERGDARPERAEEPAPEEPDADADADGGRDEKDQEPEGDARRRDDGGPGPGDPSR